MQSNTPAHSPMFSPSDDSEDAVTYRNLKSQHKKLEHNFITMTKISALLSTLTEDYKVNYCSTDLAMPMW